MCLCVVMHCGAVQCAGGNKSFFKALRDAIIAWGRDVKGRVRRERWVHVTGFGVWYHFSTDVQGDIDKLDNHGNTPISWASLHGHANVV